MGKRPTLPAFIVAHFIFISGSEETAESWQECRERLEALGHSWAGVSLCDLPWDAGFETAYNEGLSYFRSTLPTPEATPVMLGHSAGGLMLPRFGDALKAQGEIYVAALAAAPGKNFLEQLFEDPLDVFVAEWLTEVRRAPKASSKFLKPLYQERFAGYAGRRRVYIRCERDACISPAWQHYAAVKHLPNATLASLDMGHDPQIEMPHLLAQHLHMITGQWPHGSTAAACSMG